MDGGTRTARATRPAAAGETSSARLTSPELSTNTPAQVAHCKPMQRCLLLPGAGPARLACSATCRQRQCSSDTGRGQQQRRAVNFLLLHQLSLSFNSSQTLDPKSNAISQAAGVPRVAGVAADTNKVLFSFSFMQFLAGAGLSPQRPHPESSRSLILYAK